MTIRQFIRRRFRLSFGIAMALMIFLVIPNLVLGITIEQPTNNILGALWVVGFVSSILYVNFGIRCPKGKSEQVHQNAV